MTLHDATTVTMFIILCLLVLAWFEMYRHRFGIAEIMGTTPADVASALKSVAIIGAAIVVLVMV